MSLVVVVVGVIGANTLQKYSSHKSFSFILSAEIFPEADRF